MQSVDQFDYLRNSTKHKAMSVENAFQAIKVLYTDLSKEDKAIKFNHILSLQSAKQARAEGKALPINEEKLRQWDSISGKVLQALMKASFEQNKDVAQALVDTGDKIIKHQDAKGVEMDKRFAPALTQIRRELMDEGYSPNIVKQQDDSLQDATQGPSKQQVVIKPSTNLSKNTITIIVNLLVV